jgi:hypothetical protein
MSGLKRFFAHYVAIWMLLSQADLHAMEYCRVASSTVSGCTQVCQANLKEQMQLRKKKKLQVCFDWRHSRKHVVRGRKEFGVRRKTNDKYWRCGSEKRGIDFLRRRRSSFRRPRHRTQRTSAEPDHHAAGGLRWSTAIARTLPPIQLLKLLHKEAPDLTDRKRK